MKSNENSIFPFADCFPQQYKYRLFDLLSKPLNSLADLSLLQHYSYEPT